MQETAAEYLQQGISVIPVNTTKQPTVPSWSKYQKQALSLEEAAQVFSQAQGIAVIAGKVSKGLEVIDIDTKNDLTGSLGQELLQLLEDNLPPEQYQAIRQVRTPSGGYHLLYRCQEPGRNSKLASRHTTAQEQEQNPKEKIKGLIETRGEGGYALAPPTPGYTHTAGPKEPGRITEEARQIIWSIAKSFNQVEEPKAPHRATPAITAANPGSSPFADYNTRADAVQLLEQNGWKVVNQQGPRINLKRPGQSDAKTSGNYHTEHRKLYVFSTSTEFNPEQTYSPADIFTLLECQGDKKLAYKRLLELGFGSPLTPGGYRPTQTLLEQITVNSVNSSTPLAAPGQMLKIENLQGSQAVEIQSPGPQAYQEILQALAVMEQAEQVQRIYIREQDNQYTVGAYKLQQIATAYTSDALTPQDIDNLLEEVINLVASLEPIDRAMVLQQFLSWEGVQELGITKESLEAAADKIQEKASQIQQEQAVARALRDAQEMLTQGKTQDAIKHLQEQTRTAQAVSKQADFKKMLQPTSREEMIAWAQAQPGGIDTGFIWKKEPLLLPGGALTVIAAPTNHGKTAALINIALNTLEKHEDKSVLFLTYEQGDMEILQLFLNTYADMYISQNNRRSIKSYYAGGGSLDMIAKESREEFKHKEQEFYKLYLKPGRLLVKYPEYDTTNLTALLRYAKKQNPSLGAVFLDYFQVLKMAPGEAKRNGSRHEELKEICLQLKDVAIETGLPIINAAQFTREVTAPHHLHPTYLADAADIERIANTLLGLWNYGKDAASKAFKNKEEAQEYERKYGKYQKCLEVQMLKSRELATGGQAIWKYNGNTGKLTHEEQEEEEVIWQTQTVQEAIKAQKNKLTQSSGE
jgi:replicative DNA helicase